MKVIFFCHSLVTDWNHCNAHFLRGVITELMARGVDVFVYEQSGGENWSNLAKEYGEETLEGFRRAYPDIEAKTFERSNDLNRILSGADAVIVHEWNDPELVQRIGEHRRVKGHYVLLVHDAHHRSLADTSSLAEYDLSQFDGVLAFGNALREHYLNTGNVRRAWTWYDAADTRIFHPIPSPKTGDLVWVGNWGEHGRGREYREFLLRPVSRLGIRAKVYGRGFPDSALREMRQAGIEYGGWVPNFEVPKVFSKYRVTLQLPRATEGSDLGIPTSGMFEALACGIPLVTAPWNDRERLFTKADFLVARSAEEMEAQISWVLHNEAAAREIASHGRRTVLERHTCSHRADELLQIIDSLQRDAVKREIA